MIIDSICYVEIQLHRVSQFQVLMHILLYFTVICIPIKSHQSNQTYSTTLRSFIIIQYLYSALYINYSKRFTL
jgi:hypothetical protein